MLMKRYSVNTRPHQHDVQDGTHFVYSNGIVENPLYAEQEDCNTLSYASLKEKEKAAEVRDKDRV
jgi:hypothetical protein